MLLSPTLSRGPPQACFSCFQQIIFPLLQELLLTRPMARAEAAALEETRQRASALASKIFLQYMNNIVGSSGFEDLWMQLLQYTELYMKADNSELLAEAVTESLKNTLLVMSASNVLHPSAEGHAEDIWEKTWSRIDAFCPSVKQEFYSVLDKTNPVSQQPTQSPRPSE